MKKWIRNNRYLVSRRFVQSGFLLLFAGGNYFGWEMLRGNYSSAQLFGTVYLSDPFAVVQIMAAGFMLQLNVLIGALTVFGFYGIFGGRSFCSWVCPMNIISDTAIWIRKHVAVFRKESPLRPGRSARYWVMAMAVALSALFGFAAFEMVSPISMLHRGVIYGFGFGLAGVGLIFLFDLFVVSGGWCGHICPLGGFYSVIGKFSLWRVNHDKKKCTECNRCFAVCPEKQVLSIINKASGSILYGECTNCGRCIESCRDKALKFGLIKKIKD